MASHPDVASTQPGQGSEPFVLALGALGWAIADPARADRLLGLTGLTPADLRARAGDPALLAAVLAYLAAHEPDLIACAESLGTTPATLAAAGRALA
ncbi:DUF3572 family protein [Sphingomonas bacterium]|uniref:DUF3572 family protein n=1 Tax=Sphingomonas bacterium TaxID=1895847 RepID=UPI001577595B|nr:DUF3572 family protein [Sphingomonas bacterium]